VIRVDATRSVAHVIFDDSTTLGVNIAGSTSVYRVGTALTVELGETKDIVAYNGDSSGAITFTLSFSGAHALAVSGMIIMTMSSVMN
jgi:hypothetical protein